MSGLAAEFIPVRVTEKTVWLFVSLSDGQLTGWGEATLDGQEQAVEGSCDTRREPGMQTNRRLTRVVSCDTDDCTSHLLLGLLRGLLLRGLLLGRRLLGGLLLLGPCWLRHEGGWCKSVDGCLLPRALLRRHVCV